MRERPFPVVDLKESGNRFKSLNEFVKRLKALT